MKGRRLDLVLEDPYSNLALEEGLFVEAEVPTLRLWENQKSVVIGRAQLAKYETNMEYCKNQTIPIVRRMSAGGAVFNGPGNLNWSFFVPRNGRSPGPMGDAKSVFNSFAAIISEALKKCGVKSEFVPPNTLVDDSGKICGMAAYLSKEKVLCHGTLLIDADLQEVQMLTKPSATKITRRYPRSKFARVSNCGVKRSDFVSELAGSWLGFEMGDWTARERKTCSRLVEKYRS
ncbi:MAG TPA: lipoate--protein ligase family protein, partial [Nitrososphaerales archaeon]|nr:lipoate--protein ligase family protein [Nitrososphaerales archaeon]